MYVLVLNINMYIKLEAPRLADQFLKTHFLTKNYKRVMTLTMTIKGSSYFIQRLMLDMAYQDTKSSKDTKYDQNIRVTGIIQLL